MELKEGVCEGVSFCKKICNNPHYLNTTVYSS